MLRADGVCSQKISTVPAAIGAELTDFDHHLIEVRGLAASTRTVRLRHLLEFLTDRFGRGSIRIPTLAPSDVARFMTRYTAGLAPGSIKAAGISLRSYFCSKPVEDSRLKRSLPPCLGLRNGVLPDCQRFFL
jgi:hypothetical protein